MAFQQNAASNDGNNNNVSPFPRNNSSRGQNSAAGFLNFYVPTRGGGRRKLGYLILNENRAFEADIANKLKNDPALVAKLVSMLEVEFNTAEATEDGMIDL